MGSMVTLVSKPLRQFKSTIAVSTRKRVVVTPIKWEFQSVKRSSPGTEFKPTVDALTRDRNAVGSATRIPQRMMNEVNRENLKSQKNTRNLKFQKNTRNLKIQKNTQNLNFQKNTRNLKIQ